jgi:hypothetical protein
MDWWTKSTGAAVAALMLAAPTVAWAEWHRVTTSSKGSIYSVDPERVRTIGGRRQVWMKGDHGRNPTEKARSSMTSLSIDCSASTIKTLSDSRYDSFGKTISSRSFPDYGVGYEPITPETIAEGVAKAVCFEEGAAM